MVKALEKFSREIIITNELGIHARSAAKIVALAKDAKSLVWIIKDGEKADASGILDILTLECTQGSKIIVEIADPSDLDILNAIAELVEKGFEE
jgi:phosphotransferase system HPr (HPr) family protein